MKKLIIFCLILAFGITLQAKTNDGIGIAQAKTMINKTNEFIFIARKELRTHHVYSGDFSKAVHYQRLAIGMFKDRKYTKAYFLSFTARYFANKSINANTGNHRLFIQTLSDIDQRIVIDDTSAGISDPWPGPSATLKKKNNWFVKVATENVYRRDIDPVGNYNLIDEDLENGDLEIEDQ